MLARLHNDHKHIAILLTLLQKKQHRLENAKTVNFNLIRDIVEYMQSYTEHSHHPLEDLIDDFYTKKYATEVNEKRLADEHERLVESSSTLMATLNLILSDIPVQLELMSEALKEYVELQTEHMIYEEQHLFPQWQARMTDEDWVSVAAQCKERLISDPLFNDDDNVLFEELRDYLAKVDD